ncbi:MAG: molecular chaperone TorD family protein [Coriobacteriales bacterium]|jgi:TorA maturation chaperone TorD|nr:molecular chaperone TorD family protein [Coriobacteriales bacterium]
MNGLSHKSRLELSKLCEQRAATYGMLSRLFRLEVDHSLLHDLHAASFPIQTGNDNVDAGYRKIATFLGGEADSALLELSVDYARTFIGHGNNAYSAAYPFESVYTSEKRLMMQEARDEFIDIYHAAGMEISEGWKDPEDHIALELEYLQILCGHTTETLDKNEDEHALELLDKQREFLAEHLAAWAPMMTADMKRFAQTEFYQGLACLTEGFLKVDRDFLKNIISVSLADTAASTDERVLV